jgi:integrase
MKRHKTSYPGVFYREAERIGGKGLEKVYYIVFKKDGKVHEEKVGRQYADDMTPARASKIRADRVEGKRPSRKELRAMREAEKKAVANRWTLDRLWEEYSTPRPLNKGLITDRGRYQNFIKPDFGHKEPHEILSLDIHRLKNKLSKTHKPQTVKHVLLLLQRLVNFGVNKGLCSGLDFKIEMPMVHNLKTEDLTPEQLSALMAAIDQEYDIQAANMMRLPLCTGMRRGELFRLKWTDLDFEKDFIHIRNPKGGRDQVIPMNQVAREVLESHPRTDSPYVFPGQKGNQRVRAPKKINTIKKRAGLPKDFRALHGLRHVYASMLVSSGQVDLYTLQKLLTHKSPAMTQRYAHLRDEALRRASDLAGELLTQAINGNGKKVVNREE